MMVLRTFVAQSSLKNSFKRKRLQCSLRRLTDVLGRISPEHYVTIKSPLINHKFLIHISLSLITSRLKVRDLRDQTRMLPEVQFQPTSKPLPQF